MFSNEKPIRGLANLPAQYLLSITGPFPGTTTGQVT